MKVDQVSAEDWPVQAIIYVQSGDKRGLNELLDKSIDRHANLASMLFGKPVSQCGKDVYGNDTPERFFGKKTRHAGQYDMGPDEMAKQMAKENHVTPVATCSYLLEKFHSAEPSIRGVYHKWVQDELSRSRTLITPLGRERIFFGIHPYRDNTRIFKSAYSQVPQSTIGDNTGFAVLYIEDQIEAKAFTHEIVVLVDEHDGILLELDDTIPAIQEAAKVAKEAYNRTLTFNGPHGTIDVQIPIDISIGYDLVHLKKVGKDCLETYPNPGLERIVNGLKNLPKAPPSTTSGPLPQSSEPVLKGVYL